LACVWYLYGHVYGTYMVLLMFPNVKKTVNCKCPILTYQRTKLRKRDSTSLCRGAYIFCHTAVCQERIAARAKSSFFSKLKIKTSHRIVLKMVPLCLPQQFTFLSVKAFFANFQYQGPNTHIYRDTAISNIRYIIVFSQQIIRENELKNM
jgi:hypothetical protein